MGWYIMTRLNWVDNTKAIAIYLVVLGHSIGLDTSIRHFIYSFHLPIFLVISGFLLSKKINKLTFNTFVSKQIKNLIKLYFLFSFISIILFGFISILKNKPFNIVDLAYGTLYGTHGVEKLLGHGNDPLWYLPFFVGSLFIFYFSLKLPKSLGVIVVAALALFSVNYHGIRLPWSLDVAGVGVLFLLIGSEINKYYEKINIIFSSKLSLYLIPIIGVGLFYLTLLNGSTNINRVLFGDSIGLYFLNAIIGCWLVITVSHNIKITKTIELISTHTLIIFSIHLYFLKTLGFVTSIDNNSIRNLLIMFLCLIVVVLCAQISRLIMPLLNKHIIKEV